MAKVIVLYYSSYGHVETMAQHIAEGAKSVAGVEVTLKRVPETIPVDQARAIGVKVDQAAPVATVDELADYDAIIFGTPTRFGNMAGQMRTFLDQTGGLWMKGALVGKIGSVFASTGTVNLAGTLRPLNESNPRRYGSALACGGSVAGSATNISQADLPYQRYCAVCRVAGSA